ncbi:hypothetical protein [Pedobacter faecalis]|uniref:hypothetical protein n=1 Tax=Pedobacter faecalis TaxID=3041495 RepID=UPI00254FB787|nr:hypothetical protein [Pedobacter sp. ELA7]
MMTTNLIKLAAAMLLLVLSVPFHSQAQQTTSGHKGIAKGLVKDTTQNYVLRSATVSVYRAADSSLLNYQITNNYGEFVFKTLPVGIQLRLDVSYVGYNPFRKTFVIPADKGEIDLKTLVVQSRDVMLKDIVITVPPISMNGDTLEFNAAAFKLDSNAVVEDLLRKIPNIVLWGDGQVTVNGREVKNILVNGKPFFGGNTKIATQNISKDALEKIQVYSTLKDEKNLLDSTLEMNLKLKKGKEIGYFGKLGGGYGTDRRFESDASFNIFTPKMQLAIIGTSNNINKQANSINTLMESSTFKGTGTNVEYQPDFRATGINRGKSGGMAFTYNLIEKPTWENKKTLKANYFLTDNERDNNSDQVTTTTLPNADRIKEESIGTNLGDNTRQRFDSEFEWVKKSKSFKVSQNLNRNQGENNNQTFRTALNADDVMTSTNNSSNLSNFNNMDFNLTADFRLGQNYNKWDQRFKGFDVRYSLNVIDNQDDRTNFTEFRSMTDPAANRKFNRRYDSKFNETTHRMQLTLNSLRSLIFGKAQLAGIDFNAYNNIELKHNTDNDRVDDMDTISNAYRQNAYLSNNVQMDVFDQAPGIRISKTFSKNLSNRYYENLTLSFSPKQRMISQQFKSVRSFQNIKRNYTQFMPDASVQYSDNQYGEYYRNYNLDFNTVVRMPSLEQLAPLTDSSNVYYLRRGNIALNQAVERVLSFNFNHSDQTTKNTLNYGLYARAASVRDNIVDSVLIDSLNRRTVYSVNAQGNKYANINGNIRKAFKFKSAELQLGTSGDIYVGRNPGFTNNAFAYSKQLNSNIRVNGTLTYKSLFALEVSESLSTYRTVQEAFNTRFSGKNLSTAVSTSYNVTKKLTLNSNISVNTSSSSSAENVNFTIWNASAIYRFLKGNNGEIKFSALDLLHQNSSVINYGNASSVTVGRQNVLQQYFMTTLSYYPRKFGKNQPKK